MYHAPVTSQVSFRQSSWPIGIQKLTIDFGMRLVRTWKVRYPRHVFDTHETNAADVVDVVVAPFMRNRRSIADAESLA